jgi:flagellar biosynthesis protein FliR
MFSDMFGALSPFLLWGMILGLVELSKKFGLQGNWLIVESSLLGLFFGMVYQLSIAIPDNAFSWLGVVVYSILFGLSVSGFYDLGKRAGNALTK